MIRVWMAGVLLGVSVGCATPDGGGGSGPVELTVLCYNIHHGEGTDGKLDLERIARVIRESNADLVGLQEVDRKATRTGGIDQTAELARLTGMHHVFGQAMDFQGGGYGQAVLSRWPIESHAVHQLPQRTNREPRIALVTKIKGPIPNLTFATTHLDHQLEPVRIEQAGALRQLFPSDAPSILVGDFNSVPESAPIKSMLLDFIDAAGPDGSPTIPSDTPRRRIDYILLRPAARWEPLGAHVPAEPVASDHRPVVARVQYQGR